MSEKSKKRRDILKESNHNFFVDRPHNTDAELVYPKDELHKRFLIKLPYATNALAPYLSKRTLYHHYNDHHLGYYNKLKAFIDKNPKYTKMHLKDFIKASGTLPELKEIHISAVLNSNHNFYWQSMKPGGGIGSEKESILTKAVIDSFGSINAFRKKFTAKAMKIGLGWMWLFKTGGGIKIVRTDYTTSLLSSHFKPLFVIDVWEHAYYLDYGNSRQKYIENYLSYMVNWDFADANFNR